MKVTMTARIITLLLIFSSTFALAEPDVVYDKRLTKKLKVQPCTDVALPLLEDVDVKEAIECDYPEMEVIRISRTPQDQDIVKVKLYAKGKMKNIFVHYPSGLTVTP